MGKSKSKSKGKGQGTVMVVWSLRMAPDVIAAVRRRAKAEGVSSSDVVRAALAKRMTFAAMVRK